VAVNDDFVPNFCLLLDSFAVSNFYDAACDYPQDAFEQITRRLLGAEGFAAKATAFKRECRKAFDLGRQK
jgi:hypothetical protein